MANERSLITTILFVGVGLQFILAGFFFFAFYAFSDHFMVNDHLRLGVSLLSAFILATPLGFILSNFIFRMIKPLRARLDETSDYHGTQKLLLWCLVASIIVVLLAFGFFYMLDH